MYLVHYWTGRIVWTGPDEGSGRNMAWMEQYLPGLYPPCVVDRLPNDAMEIKAFDRFSIIHVDGNNSGPRCACVRGVPLKMFSAGRILFSLTGCSGRGGGSVDCFDWPRVDCAVDFSPSEGVVPLRSIPDVVGLVGRREGAAESRVLQGRDAHSVRVLVPDCRGVDQNFHDVTIVDMGDMPESAVSIPELSALFRSCRPPAVLSHMGWRQKELEEMRSAAKVKFRQSRPSCCEFCGSLIKSDMYRHVAHLHLAVPGVVVQRLEGHASGLYGSPAWSPQCSVGGQVGLP